MKKIIFSFKSLLIAAGLLMGSANAWAQETITSESAGNYYYLYNPDAKLFVSRGKDVACQAHLDRYGAPLKLQYDSENSKYSFLMGDNDWWLGYDIYCYTDATSLVYFTLSGTSTGYQLTNTNNNLFIYNCDGVLAANGSTEGETPNATTAKTTWQFLTQTQRDAIISS